MSLSELIGAMADMSIETMKVKKFGKKRALSPEHTDGSGHERSRGFEATTLVMKKYPTPASELRESKSVRYVPRAVKHAVWMRDRGTCVKCGSRRNLNLDHIKPVALGGGSAAENMQILCFQCNQRRAMKTFGVEHMGG